MDAPLSEPTHERRCQRREGAHEHREIKAGVMHHDDGVALVGEALINALDERAHLRAGDDAAVVVGRLGVVCAV